MASDLTEQLFGRFAYFQTAGLKIMSVNECRKRAKRRPRLDSMRFRHPRNGIRCVPTASVRLNVTQSKAAAHR